MARGVVAGPDDRRALGIAAIRGVDQHGGKVFPKRDRGRRTRKNLQRKISVQALQNRQGRQSDRAPTRPAKARSEVRIHFSVRNVRALPAETLPALYTPNRTR